MHALRISGATRKAAHTLGAWDKMENAPWPLVLGTSGAREGPQALERTAAIVEWGSGLWQGAEAPVCGEAWGW